MILLRRTARSLSHRCAHHAPDISLVRRQENILGATGAALVALIMLRQIGRLKPGSLVKRIFACGVDRQRKVDQ